MKKNSDKPPNILSLLIGPAIPLLALLLLCLNCQLPTTESIDSDGGL